MVLQLYDVLNTHLHTVAQRIEGQTSSLDVFGSGLTGITFFVRGNVLLLFFKHRNCHLFAKNRPVCVMTPSCIVWITVRCNISEVLLEGHWTNHSWARIITWHCISNIYVTISCVVPRHFISKIELFGMIGGIVF